MINLGPYSGKKCPNVRFQPTVLDRILEGTALLIVLVTWISIYWLYTQREGALLPAVWVMGGCSIFCFLLMGDWRIFPSVSSISLFGSPSAMRLFNICLPYALPG